MATTEDIQVIKDDESAWITELKHSIKIHLLIMAGPSQQLCAFLVKTIDLIEDNDQQRKEQETLQLAFNVIEAVALHVQQAIDARAKIALHKNNPMPENVRVCSDQILISLGNTRSNKNKSEAKTALLTSIGQALDLLSSFTGAIYPTIYDINGNKLNNRDLTSTQPAGPVK